MTEWITGSGLAILVAVAGMALPNKWWYYLGWLSLGNVIWLAEGRWLKTSKMLPVWHYLIGCVGELLQGITDRRQGLNKYGEHTDAPPVGK